MAAVDPAASWTLALSVAALFAAAAVHKFVDWSRFTGALADYRVLPAPALAIAAPLVVWLEATAAALLLLPVTRPLGALLAAALLTCYAGAIAINLRRGRTTIDCGCVGASERRQIGPGLVVRNLVLAMLVLLAALPQHARVISALDVVTITGATLVAVIVYLTLDVLMANSVAVRRSP